MALISIIIPCYYNEENLPVTFGRLQKMEDMLPEGTRVEYLFIDDGSGDGTYAVLEGFQQSQPERVVLLKLAGNVGSYNAILAGMGFAKGDCCTVISADLQDPPELIPQMFDYWRQGFKLVLANRQHREEGWFKQLFAGIFHRVIRRFALKNMPKGGFDFVLFDQKLCTEVVQMDEKNTNTLFLLPWLGYPYVNIPYVRQQREIGRSRWTLAKKVKLFIDSFIAFSFFPIRMIAVSGLILGVLAMGYALYILYARLTGHIDVEGWSALMLVILLVSSFQMVALGILGEYLWRTLDAVRKRPNFVIDQVKDGRV
ncbi:MAG: glycosyltransferase family 2 protein [Saprospiraceae bacterium]|nr:glycosyltransferase family 2 protein [Saprospiraceae bacterium]